MKKILIAVMAVAVLGTAACSGNKSSSVTSDSLAVAADSTQAPVMKFDAISYDFGKIKEGEKVSYNFKFKNDGKTPLVIAGATATCGCTTPDYPRQPIAPGESGEIKVVFDSEGRNGMQNKIITVNSNANPVTSQLYLVGEVLGTSTSN